MKVFEISVRGYLIRIINISTYGRGIWKNSRWPFRHIGKFYILRISPNHHFVLRMPL